MESELVSMLLVEDIDDSVQVPTFLADGVEWLQRPHLHQLSPRVTRVAAGQDPAGGRPGPSAQDEALVPHSHLSPRRPAGRDSPPSLLERLPGRSRAEQQLQENRAGTIPVTVTSKNKTEIGIKNQIE